MDPELYNQTAATVQPLTPQDLAAIRSVPSSDQALSEIGSGPQAWTDFSGNETNLISQAFKEEFPEFRTNTTSTSTNVVNSYEQRPIANPLHDYESYTYNLSLHLLGTDNFNQLVGSLTPDKTYIPQNVLVVSAGRFNQFFNRDPSFKEDFYFDNFRMKTYITTTSRNRNSNLIECSFNIIEPNGFTFINRLIEAVNRLESGANSYIQMPYLLQIDFFGSKNGDFNNFNAAESNLAGPIAGMSKYIPLRLVEIKTKVSNRGTEYQITAVPYNHQAYNQLYVSLPIATTITGSLVKDMFSGASVTPDSPSVEELLSQRDIVSKQILQNQTILDTVGDLTREESDYYAKQIEIYKRQLTSQFNILGITGYCDAINEYYRKLKSDGLIGELSTVRVEFDPEIGNAKLMKNPVNIASVPVSGSSINAQRASIQGQNNQDNQRKGQLTYDGATINIPAGMTIDKLLDWAVRNSDYIGNQIKDPEKLAGLQNGATPTDSWLQWFKITPSMKIKSFDQKQNRYAYDIVFYVKKFKVSNKYPYAPRGKVPGYVKKYDYIFTGKNNDILDLSLDFNLLAITELSMARNKDRYVQTGVGLNNPAANPDVDIPERQFGVSLNKEESVNKNPNPVQLAFVNDNPKTSSRGRGGILQDSTVAGDIQRNLMIPAKGDMITVDLKILGDPHFIKQDDLFYYQTAKTYNQQFISADAGSSLYMDGSELYVFLNFESPVDYDESLGLALKTDKYRYSEFSGVYKVITVENVFQKGMFTQVLNLVKLFYDQDGKEIPSIYQRIDSIAQSQLTPTARIQSARYAGPSVNLAALRSGQIQNVQTAIQSTVNQAAGIVQSASLIGQIGQQVVNQAIGKAVSAAVGKGIGVVTRAGKDLFNNLTAVKVDPNVFDIEDAALGQAFSENLAASLPSDLPATWSEAELDLGDINNLDIGFLEPIDLGDYSNLDIGFEF
jgi:hypothetical protein